MRSRPGRSWGRLVAYLGVSFGVAAIGGLANARSLDTWYPTLAKPSWTPPPGVFGPVWTVLYVLMGVAAWLVHREVVPPARRTVRRQALLAWGLQLALNASWSLVFFGLRRIGASVAVIVALWASLLGTITLAARVSPLAALLLLPYLAWVTFASALNVAIWRLNSGD